MTVDFPTKSVVSVAEMARQLSLSRSRLYQLIEQGIFPPPIYDVQTKRPFFNEEMQVACLEVRRRNCGINGKPILFYCPRHPPGSQQRPIKKAKSDPKSKNQYADLIDGLRGTSITDEGLKLLSRLKNLTTLSLRGLEVTKVGLKSVGDCRKLEVLDLSHTKTTDTGLKALRGLQNLTSINLSHTIVTDAGCKVLSELKQLKTVDLSFIRMGDPVLQLTDAALQGLSGLTSLTSINIDNSQIGSGQFHFVRLTGSSSSRTSSCAGIGTITRLNDRRPFANFHFWFLTPLIWP